MTETPELVNLTEYLNARLDEAEARAKAMKHFTVYEQPYYSCAGSRTEPYGDLPWGEDACDCFLAQRKARALREVASDRQILAEREQVHGKFAEFSASTDRELSGWWAGRVIEVDRVVSIRAAVYSDHPDYRRDWPA